MAGRQVQKLTGLGIQYEDLVPKSEWNDQPEATILTIDLPGFTKEQIQVTYVHTTKMIRVTGECPVADRKWSRFNEVFSVPQNCLVDKIHGSFRNDVLTITLPKETITKKVNQSEASKTEAAALDKAAKLEEKRLLEESRMKEKEEEEAKQRKKQLLREKEELIKKLQEDKEKAEMRRLQEEAKENEKAEARKLLEEAKEKEKAEMRKLQEEAEMRKLQEEAKAQEKAKERKLAEQAKLEKIQEKKSVNESGGKDKILNPEERKLPEVVYTKSGSGCSPKTGLGGGLGGLGEVVKPVEEKLSYLVEKEKKMGRDIMEKIRRKEITSEEKKLMVNVGVAALVIFALGAYVSYTFCSSSSSSSASSSPSSSSSTKPE